MPATFDPLQVLAERFRAAIAAAFPEGGAGEADPLITGTKNPTMGDFQSNAAMPLSKKLGAKPRDIAAAIVAKLDLADLAEPLSEASIAGPGFINIRLRADTLGALLQNLDTPDLGIAPPATPQTVVVDLCGVNLAKQMHVGHLRSTIIGDTLARVLARLGHTVKRQNHVGDWGLPIAMVTGRVQREAAAGRLSLDRLTLDDLDRLYKASQRECEADERGLAAVRRYGIGPKAEAELTAQVEGAREILAGAKRTLLRLQSHEPKTFAVWKRIAEVTMEACLATVARLNAVVLPEHSAGESSYAEELPSVVEDLLRRGIAEESEGAVVVRLDEFGIAEPCIIRKSDGGYLYATTDMAAIRRRVQKLGAGRVVYAVDARQGLHFKQVFAAATRAGYATRTGNSAPAHLEHAAFGTVLGEDGRPFKTRTGENVKLADLIDEAEARAERVVAEKSPGLAEADRRVIARAVAVAALRYADLSSDRIKDYVFSFDRMLAFEGNTGPYLLYAVVRVHNIFRKASERGVGGGWEGAPFLLHHAAEKALALALLRYPPVVSAAADALEPHRLCQYLYDLAGAFSSFYDACHVVDAQTPEARLSRLRLCRLTLRTLEDGLHLLGIPTLERM
ncbi:MAG: arginine--tRNA ligase [Phycisphaerales bacterium]